MDIRHPSPGLAGTEDARDRGADGRERLERLQLRNVPGGGHEHARSLRQVAVDDGAADPAGRTDDDSPLTLEQRHS